LQQSASDAKRHRRFADSPWPANEQRLGKAILDNPVFDLLFCFFMTEQKKICPWRRP
jgi:hypothetical protein